MNNDPDSGKAQRADAKLRIIRPAQAGPVLEFAAREMSDGLGAMLAQALPIEASGELSGPRIVLTSGAAGARPKPARNSDDYSILPDENGIVLRGANERRVLDAVYRLMRELGASFPLGAPAQFPRVEPARLAALAPVVARPAFDRRCLVSDIMTWHYAEPQPLEQHLAHDREFIPWMARNGINAFFYIRHAFDTQYRIDEIRGLFSDRGIDVEYGGHVIQQLLPRERFADHPEYFPANAEGVRQQMGNLCVSNPGALTTARNGALEYLGRHPDTRLLHVWGADVWKGAWCMCDRCREIAPQLQYLDMVNAIASAAADGFRDGKAAPAIAYLAYHDTIDPVRGMRPLANVAFEWAPRERCYSHAIDDPDCATNPRYFAGLKRYMDLFEGRGHVFEYYADAILFGGLGFAMPSVIARDLRAYRALGIRSISCLTFGAFSVFAYPVNLIAFSRLAVDPDEDPEALLDDSLAQLSSRVPIGDGTGISSRTARLRAHADLWRGAAAVQDAAAQAVRSTKRGGTVANRGRRGRWRFGPARRSPGRRGAQIVELWHRDPGRPRRVPGGQRSGPARVARPSGAGFATPRAAADARNPNRHQGNLGNLRPRALPFDLDRATPRPPTSPAGRLQLLNRRFQGTLEADLTFLALIPPQTQNPILWSGTFHLKRSHSI